VCPLVLKYSFEEDIKNTHLKRRTRHASIGLYGQSWCIPEFASLNQKLH
jgi:hypothetical protein